MKSKHSVEKKAINKITSKTTKNINLKKISIFAGIFLLIIVGVTLFYEPNGTVSGLEAGDSLKLSYSMELADGEVILAEAIKKMIEDGKMVYGYEIEGEWLECGKTADWLKSFLFLSLNDPEYAILLKTFLKEKKIKL